MTRVNGRMILKNIVPQENRKMFFEEVENIKLGKHIADISITKIVDKSGKNKCSFEVKLDDDKTYKTTLTAFYHRADEDTGESDSYSLSFAFPNTGHGLNSALQDALQSWENSIGSLSVGETFNKKFTIHVEPNDPND